MADLGFTFNAADIEPSTPFESDPLPAGKYHVQVVNSELRNNKNTVGRHIWLELAIVDGEHTNKRIFDQLNIENPSEKAQQIAKGRFSAICYATGQMSIQNTEQLHNRSLIASIKVVPAVLNENGDVKYKAKNEVTGYTSMNGGYQPVAQVQSAPASQPAAAAQRLQNAPWKRNAV